MSATMTNATIHAALEKIRQTYAGDLADLIWEKSVKGFDSVLAYNPDNDELEIHIFSPGTVWNDECRSLYLRKFADPLTIEVYDYSDLGDEFREYDGEQELDAFAEDRGIDLEERFRNIHDFYLVEDSDIIREIMDDLDEQLLQVHCYAANQFESPLAEIEAWGKDVDDCHEELLRQYAEWQGIAMEGLSVVWCPQSGKAWLWDGDEQTDVWIVTEEGEE